MVSRIFVLIVMVFCISACSNSNHNTQTTQTVPPAALANVVSTQPVGSEKFAKCIQESGTQFYGAHWCGHCNSQKKLFGENAKYLPYNECSDENRNMVENCKKKNITSYPTWIFPNNIQKIGSLSLEQLANHTSCELEIT